MWEEEGYVGGGGICGSRWDMWEEEGYVGVGGICGGRRRDMWG